MMRGTVYQADAIISDADEEEATAGSRLYASGSPPVMGMPTTTARTSSP
jgi:hypothetical protein